MKKIERPQNAGMPKTQTEGDENEKSWVENVKHRLDGVDFGENIKIATQCKLPYAQEVIKYYKKDNELRPGNINSQNVYETDLMIYEEIDNTINPRVVIEAKLSRLNTHEPIIYSHKALQHKSVTPYLRYGIMIGNIKDLPRRLFRHGVNFDFMISFKNYNLTEHELSIFVELLVKEVRFSRQIEEMLFDRRKSTTKHYFVMQKMLSLDEI
jgi:hypothetical protein